MDTSYMNKTRIKKRQVHDDYDDDHVADDHEHDDDDDDSKHKSKNLHAERRRRDKLNKRLLELRSLVPIITNMKKETIITDAIAYIKRLQNDVKLLSDQLLKMESLEPEDEKPRSYEIFTDAKEEMKKYGIEEDVTLMKIDENKFWMKMVFEKKIGQFSKLLETMTFVGLELTDVNVTTSNGAMLISTCVSGSYGDTLDVEQTRAWVRDIIRSF